MNANQSLKQKKGIVRWAKSYSIIDHQLLHGGYFNRLSHESLILYLFLAVVGNREGISFYKDSTIREILRIGESKLDNARTQLIEEKLIHYREPYWWVKNMRRE